MRTDEAGADTGRRRLPPRSRRPVLRRRALRPDPRVQGRAQPARPAGPRSRRSRGRTSTASPSTCTRCASSRSRCRSAAWPATPTARAGSSSCPASPIPAGTSFTVHGHLPAATLGRCATRPARLGGRSSPTASSSRASPAARRRGSPATTGPTTRPRTASRSPHRRTTTSSSTARSSRPDGTASATTWLYEQAEPMATYLATVQIGRYDVTELSDGAGPAPGRPPGHGARPA